MLNQSPKYNCIIVDDFEIDRLTTLSFCKQIAFINTPICFESANSALAYAEKNVVDIGFLDIDMPMINGFELRKKLKHITACIFVTSHAEYALESYETEAFDFLTKPIGQNRFIKCINRLEEYLQIKRKATLLDYTLGADTVFIKEGNQSYKVLLHEIIYVEALKDYTSIVTANKKYCVLIPISSLLKQKEFSNFIRIHRSYAVQKHFVKQFNSKEVFIESISLPIGRSYKNEINL
jgi:two-component system, LytTR family, response regulator